MSLPVTVISLAGSVALLLWGIRMVQTGIQRALGAQLRNVLGAALRNRVTSLLAGMGVTAVLQSSTATGLMMTGFAAGGLVGLVPALAVMLGANIGTTLIVQLLSFDVAEFAPALILIGFVLFQRASTNVRDFGRVFIGLGLLLMALHQFIALLAPYEDEPNLRLLLGAISTQPILDVLLGAVLTWAAHSSVAVVLLVMSFAAQGVVPPNAAFALVLGANLGTALNPVLEGATGADPAAKRLPIGNLVIRLAGVAMVLPFLPEIGRLAVTLQPSTGRSVADFHTAFNIALALVFLPLLGPFARLLRRCLPTRIDPTDPSRPLYLDASATEVPAIALGGATREALRMADALTEMLDRYRDILQHPDRQKVQEGRRLDDIIDALNSEIKAYLAAIDPSALTDDDHRRIATILAFATHVAQAGDIVDVNLLGAARKQMKRGVAFPKEVGSELADLAERLNENARRAASLFVTRDVRAAHGLADEKQAFREIEADASRRHFQRLRSGETDAEAGALHLDVLRHMKAVNSHLVAAAAYPVLEEDDALLPTRIKRDD